MAVALNYSPDRDLTFLSLDRAHTGIVVGVEHEERVHERDVHVCVTVEGNTNDDGSSRGHTTLRKVRTFREADGHRFVRWAEMERRAVAA